MLVNNNSTLNILLSKNNTILKEALNKADKQILENSSNKNISTNTILKNLFDSLKNNEKSNKTIENILKNSSNFKNLGSFSKNLNNLLNNISDNSNLKNFKPLIKNFIKDINTINSKNLKEQIINSGIYLESKINNSEKNSIKNLLEQISKILKGIDSQSSKNGLKIINNFLNNNSEEKQILLLKNLNTTLKNLDLNTNKNNNLNSLLESYLNKKHDTVETKNLNKMSNLLNNLNTPLSKKAINLIKTLINEKNTNQEKQTFLLKELKLTLKNLKNFLIPNNLNKLFDLTEKLNSLITKANLAESKQNNFNNSITNTDIKNIDTQTKETLELIKNEINKNNFTLPNKENILTKINNLIKTNDLFLEKNENFSIKNFINKLPSNAQTNFISNFETNLKSLSDTLKNFFNNIKTTSETNTTLNILDKQLNKLQNFTKELQNNPEILHNNTKKNIIENDMKSLLLQAKQLISINNDSSTETLKNINNLLLQIDYNQLMSIVSNSSNVYIPFLWEMLEEGNINIKNNEKEKFYCQINLTLKDYGKLDLFLGLYEKNKLDLTIYAQNNNFKELIKDNLKNLKKLLNDVNLVPANLKILNLQEPKEKNKPENIYQKNENLNNSDYKIDIRV